MAKNVKGKIKDLYEKKTEVQDTKGNVYIIISLFNSKGSNFIEILNIATNEVRVINKQSVYQWSLSNRSFKEKVEAYDKYNSLWIDDCKHRRCIAYKRWIKLKEKVTLSNDVFDVILDPHSYVEPDWFTFSRFKHWLTSQLDWENIQIRGELVLNKKVFDIDSAIVACYAPKKLRLWSEATERREIQMIKRTSRWLKNRPKYQLDLIRDSEYIVYAVHINDIVLYVGSGKKSRPNHVTNNSHNSYLRELQDKGITPEISVVYYSEVEDYARKEESDIIKEINPPFNLVGRSYIYDERTLKTFITSL